MKHLIYNKSLQHLNIPRSKGFIKFNKGSHDITLKLSSHGGRLKPFVEKFHDELLVLLSKYYFLEDVGFLSKVFKGNTSRGVLKNNKKYFKMKSDNTKVFYSRVNSGALKVKK